MIGSRTAALALAFVMGAAPFSAAMAYGLDRTVAPAREAVETTGTVYGLPVPNPGRCAPSSAAEGNANQQTRAVMQYGQTSGGTRC